MFGRIHYGTASADSRGFKHAHHTQQHHYAYRSQIDQPTVKYAAPTATASRTCTLYRPADEAAAVRSATPVRSTTPLRTNVSTPVRAPRSNASTPDASSSSFMTQAARGDVTPRHQISRASDRHAHTAPVRRGPTLLPPTPMDQRMLLVLDMDETLLHADVTPVPHDVSFVVRMDNGATTPVYVKFRPHLNRFLSVVSRLFEVVVFTASISRYANQVLDYIDPSGSLVHHRLYREHCTEVNGTYVKDLERLGRPLERVAIVDNSPVAYSFHPSNAVAIPSWYDCDRDAALQHLLPHLERMARAGHVYDDLDDIRRELRWE